MFLDPCNKSNLECIQILNDHGSNVLNILSTASKAEEAAIYIIASCRCRCYTQSEAGGRPYNELTG